MKRVVFFNTMRLFYLFGLFLFISCGEKPNSEFVKVFSISNFVSSETIKLRGKPIVLIKTVTNSNNTESQTIQQVDWSEELKPLLEYELGKQEWLMNYEIDTLSFGSHIELRYKLIKGKLPIKKLSVFFDKTLSEVIEINGERETGNLLFSSWQRLYYLPSKQLNVLGKLEINHLYSSDYASQWVVIEN